MLSRLAACVGDASCTRQGHDLNPGVGTTETALTAHRIVAGGRPGDDFLCLVVFDRHHVAGNVVLATIVGMPIEVPVMLSVVRIVNASRGWYERKPGVPAYAESCQTPVMSSTH